MSATRRVSTRVERLNGGVYTVTFTLAGFRTIRREGIELTGSFAATVNADMQIGAVEESITVTGETPIVDVQSARIQKVIDQATLTAIPTGRTPQVAAFLIPGVNINNVDVGGTNVINTTGGSLSVHGGSNADTRLLIDGVTIANTEGTGWSANMLPNMTSTQEVAVDTSSGTAENITGGLADQYDREVRRQHLLGLSICHGNERIVRGRIKQQRLNSRRAACAHRTASSTNRTSIPALADR